jgi:hypothetical protein
MSVLGRNSRCGSASMAKLAKTLTVLRNWRDVKDIINSYVYYKHNRETSIWGSVSEQDEKAIIHLLGLAAMLPGPIIEVGTLFGFSAQLIAAHKPQDKELLCVENFSWNPFFLTRSDHQLLTKKVLYYCTMHCNTKIVDRDKHDFYECYDGPRPSMVFIDAFHQYDSVMEDLRWAIKLGIPIISGHDYCDRYPGVVRAVDETFGNRVSVNGWVWAAIGA